MQLYLIRHGIAAERGSYTKDDDRPLTEQGQQRTARVAQQLKALDLKFDLILTSPLIRAQQTAEILLEAGLSQQLETFADLAPGGDIHNLLTWRSTWPQAATGHLALVGHEPDLGHWAELLIWGQRVGNLVVKKAGVIGLTLPESGFPLGQSQLFWLTPPRFLV